jgi:hypothetical protein
MPFNAVGSWRSISIELGGDDGVAGIDGRDSRTVGPEAGSTGIFTDERRAS